MPGSAVASLAPQTERAHVQLVRAHRWVVSACRALLVLLFFWHASLAHYVDDDPFISYRYARNLANGLGLVYNPGERVEGYSNFLWVVILAAAHRVAPMFDIPTIGMLFTLVTGVTLLVVIFAARLDDDWNAIGLLAGAFMVAHAGLVVWTTTGHETSPFTTLVFGGTVAFAHYMNGEWGPGGRTGLRWSAVCFGFAALMRADGAFEAAMTFVAILVVEYRRGSGRAGLMRLIEFTAVVAAFVVPHLVFRYAYYGDLLPNTAYAKAGGGIDALIRGVAYLRSYVADYSVWLWAPIVAIYLLRARRGWAWYFLWMIASTMAYVIWAGGDSLGFHRFVVHIVPPMYVLLSAALVDVYRRYIAPYSTPLVARSVALAGVAGLLVLTARPTLVPLLAPERVRWTEAQSGLSFPGDGTVHSYLWFNSYFVDRLSVAARYLEANAPPGAVVAATPAGAISYYMSHPVIDMLGLNDRHIAHAPGRYTDELWVHGRAGHEKGDGAYVLSRQPEYILLGNVAVLPYALDEAHMPGALEFKSEHEIWASPEFHARYELVSVPLADRGPFRFFTFYRRKP